MYAADKKGWLFKSVDGGQEWAELNYVPQEAAEAGARQATQPAGVVLLAD